MILFPHMLIGAGIGLKIQNFFLTFLVSLLLHFPLDRIPHWEYFTESDSKDPSLKKIVILFGKALIDLSVGALLIWVLVKEPARRPQAALGALAGILPDGVLFLRLLWRQIQGTEIELLEKFHRWHDLIHSRGQESLFWRLFLPGLVVALAFSLILN